jgi:hypothetical protein
LEVKEINSELHDTRALLQLAGLRLPAEREGILTAMREGSSLRIAEALARLDYGHAEPAFRFRPPSSGSA